MISNARGKHSSPGVYMKEVDIPYATKSLGITTLGLVGETLKGPAFEPININGWSDFQDYFGGTSTEKFKGTGYPKYELPYIAKSYLQESNQLEVCRVLGLSGYNAGPAWVIYGCAGVDMYYHNANPGDVNEYVEFTGTIKDLYTLLYKEKNGDTISTEKTDNNILLTKIKLQGRYLNLRHFPAVEKYSKVNAVDGTENYTPISNLTELENVKQLLYDANGNELKKIKVGNNYYEFKFVRAEANDVIVKYPIALLRLKGSYSGSNEGTSCQPNSSFDKLSFKDIDITLTYNDDIVSQLVGCQTVTTMPSANSVDYAPVDGYGNYGKFAINNTPVSLYPSDKDYILNVFGKTPYDNNKDIYVEEIYDYAHISACNNNLYNSIRIEKLEESNFSDYKSIYRYASTPWFVSELKTSSTIKEMNKLFRFHTISDGEYANSEIKISIMNILPDEGLFDVVIRDFNDMDSSPIVLERYNKCSMMPGTSNYIGLKIGTFDGEYANKSKYVTVEIFENESNQNSVPCGFLGYPVRVYPEGYSPVEVSYNTQIDDMIKPNRQYFGMSDLNGVDLDILKFKGVENYTTSQKISDGYTKGFHLDSTITTTNITIKVDGDDEGYEFISLPQNTGYEDGYRTVPCITNEDEMEDTVYSDVRLRKFTCYFYGGFDGWDIFRTERTNTSKFRANKYKGMIGDDYPFTNKFDASELGLTGKAITSDYYAYLAGYKQFDNPSKVKINLLATPGIDYVNNIDLVNEVLDIVEDSRQGDTLYIVTTPNKSVNGYEYGVDDAVANFESSEINTSYAATYYPWVKYYDATNKRYIDLPATKDVVRNFAYTDNVSHPWFASAGMSRGSVDCVKACKFTKLEDEDALYESMINPIKSFSSDGVKIWGNKTMYLEDTPLNRINVRRLMIRVKDLVMSASKQLIFEQNDNTVEKQFRSIVEPILANVKQNRGISDFKVQTDTSAEARDRKELPAKIWIKPINCLEYIDITFVITPEGANFEE